MFDSSNAEQIHPGLFEVHVHRLKEEEAVETLDHDNRSYQEALGVDPSPILPLITSSEPTPVF